MTLSATLVQKVGVSHDLVQNISMRWQLVQTFSVSQHFSPFFNAECKVKTHSKCISQLIYKDGFSMY